MAFRVGKAVVFALAKRANEDWDQAALNAAITKESLSIAADNYLEGLAAVRREVKDGIKVAKLAAKVRVPRRPKLVTRGVSRPSSSPSSRIGGF